MILYLTYDGLTDPLGQSQILPYLLGLANEDRTIHIISFEKRQRLLQDRNKIETMLDTHIVWHPMIYHPQPKLISTIYDLWKLNRKAKQIIKNHHIKIVHCRSYPTSVVGLKLKRKLRVKFIFDMRGFYIDERFDGGIWNKNNFIWKKLYPRLKQLESDLIQSADAIISLTHAGKKEILQWQAAASDKIKVIPCSVDTNHFNKPYTNAKDEHLNIVYLGSLGTWYLADEMLRFFKRILSQYPNSIFHFITRDNPDIIQSKVAEENIPIENIRILSATRQDLPDQLSTMDFSIYFIKPCFSKIASSPTKLGELLSMGLPVICNEGIGDIDIQSNEHPQYIITTELTDDSYQKTILEIPKILERRKKDYAQIRSVAIKHFSLIDGISTYSSIYNELLTNDD